MLLTLIALIVRNHRTDVKDVNVQLAFQLIATCLYLSRSAARVISGDETYFGDETPEWTFICNKLGIIVATVQHWIYTSVYLDCATVFQLYFTANTVENLKKRTDREKCFSCGNGILYIIVVSVSLIDLFTQDFIIDIVMKMILALISTVAFFYC